MKRSRLFSLSFILLIVTSTSFAQNSQVRVTIYNENLALVHEIRQIDLPRPSGVCSFRDVAALIDPTSVHFKSLSHPEDVSVLEQNFEYDLVSADKIMQRYLDQRVRLLTKQGATVEGRLLSASGNLVLQADDNSIKILNNSEVVSNDLPKLPEGLITRPTLVWQVENNGPANQRVEVSYLTSGMSWHSEYVSVLDQNDQNMDLTGWVSIDNQCGASFPEASILLIAGDIHRARGREKLARPQMEEMRMATAAQFEEKEFFEYHLYTLGRKSTLKDRQQKQIELLPSTRIPVKKEYTYNGVADPKNVNVTLTFTNNKESGLGIALPAGTVRMYKPEGEAQILVGEDRIEHTPRDEEVRLNAGAAFDILGERTRLSQKQLSDRSHEERVKIEIRNRKDVAVTVKVIEQVHGNWTITAETQEHAQKDANTVEWDLKVPARGTENVTYTVVRNW